SEPGSRAGARVDPGNRRPASKEAAPETTTSPRHEAQDPPRVHGASNRGKAPRDRDSDPACRRAARAPGRSQDRGLRTPRVRAEAGRGGRFAVANRADPNDADPPAR